MPLVTFLPSRKTAEVPAGTRLIEAGRLAGLELDSPCGGEGSCGRCVLRVVHGEVAPGDPGALTPEAISEGYVLGCRAALLDLPVEVDVPEQSARSGGKFYDSYETVAAINEKDFLRGKALKPLVRKLCLSVPPPKLEDGQSDLCRLTRALETGLAGTLTQIEFPALKTLAESLRAEKGVVTVALSTESQPYHIISVEPGDSRGRQFGLAVDIGTTTVALHLVALPEAKIIATRADYNDQIPCGLDVISRINYAQKPGKLEELSRRVLATLNRLTLEAADNSGVALSEITSAAISGNTTMIHLLLGLCPEYIRLEPYTPTVMEPPYLTAGEVGLNIHPGAPLYISPCVGSYVGGDITAGLLATALAADSAELSLFIDIGTNGELVIGNQDFLMACACSAGPAFEGGGIEDGMRATLGAIERVVVDAETGLAVCTTIGQEVPKGICGSGMISLLAELYLTGWLDPAGKLSRDRISPAIKVDGRRASYTLVAAEQSATGKGIVVNETDFQNIIRAKAAIYSAAALMLEQVGLGFTDLKSVFIAGGFGRFLDLEKATVLGMIPDLPKERFHFIGNSSLMGSYMVLASGEHRKRQHQLAKRLTYLELNTSPTYMDQYTAALFIPHTDLGRFPSVKRRQTAKIPA